MNHSGTEARCSDARYSRRRRHGSRGSSASRRSRCSGRKDPTCGRDYGPQKEAPEFLDRASLVGPEDLATRQDPGNQGLVRSALCFRYVAARKAWLWNLRHAEAQMGWL